MTMMATIVAIVAGTSPASAAWNGVPAFVRSIGGDGVPGVYAWGLQYNPKSNEVIASDYLSFQLRRYDLAGNPLGNFFRADNKGGPYSIAVDPNDGDIYVPELRDGGERYWIAKYDKNGTFMWAFRLTDLNHYHAWIATDAQGRLYVLDSHYTANNSSSSSRNRIRRYTVNDATRSVSGTTILTSYGTGPGQLGRAYGIDVDSSGNIWVSDAFNSVLHKYSSTGQWLGDYGQGLFSSDLRSVAIDDANGWVYVADAGASKIHKFTLSGTHLLTWGSEGSQPGQFGGGPRQLTITPGGRVWAADYGNFRINIYDSDGNLLDTAPTPGRGARRGFFSQPRDVAVNPTTGDVWVADSWNQRIQQLSADGTSLGVWGHRGANPPYGLNYPRGIGIEPATGNVWVVNERGHYIRIYDPTMQTIVGQVGGPEFDSTATNYLRWPLDVEFWNGTAIVSDRVSDLVKIFNVNTGLEIRRIQRRNWGVAVNPANGDIYVLDQTGDRIHVYTSTGFFRFTFGSSGNNPGQFRGIWDGVIHDGVLYVTDNEASRVNAFDLSGNFLGRWGTYSDGPYDFRNPGGITVDPNTGLLYIADAGNNRIQVYDLNTPRPTYSFSRPTVTITAPAPAAILTDAAQYRISGTAGGTTRISMVQVAVQDQTTGLWWRAADATWQATKTWNHGAYTGGPGAVTWSFPMNGLTPGGSYLAEAQAVDEFNTASSPNATLAFTVLADLTDDEDPDTSLEVPAADQQYLVGQPIVVQGTAVDDLGVASVRVSIGRDGNWLQPDGSFAPTFAFRNAVLGSPGGPSTTWSLTIAGLEPARYGVLVQAVDHVGKVDQVRPFVNVDVVTQDTIPPTALLDWPIPGQPVVVGTVPVAGTASDNRGVAAVEVGIRDVAAGMWLQADGTWGPTFAYVPTTLASPGAATTAWSFSFDAHTPGTYGIQARVRDTAGLVTPFRPYATFPVLTPDTTPPGGTVTEPTPTGGLVAGAAVLRGTATDDRGVAGVDVGIRDTVTGLWLQLDGSWDTAFANLPTTLTTPDQPTTNWSYNFMAAEAGRTYGFTARAVDTTGNVTMFQAFRTFLVVGPDSEPPTATMTSPTPGQTVPGGTVTVQGTAADNEAVGTVEVAVKRVATNEWLQANGTWGPTFAYLPSELTAPGATVTDWSFAFTPAANGGAYGTQARVRDAAGNVVAFRSFFQFTVQPADNVPPSGSQTSPTPGQSVAGPVVVVEGFASDNEAVGAVDVAIRNSATGLWLWADGTWGSTFAWVPAQLADPGAPSTAWSFTVELPNTGTYGVQARARDAVGNATAIRSYMTFTVT